MPTIRRLVLDVLKPHHPSIAEFAMLIAEQDPSYRVKITVVEIDEHTESIVMVVDGDNIRYDEIAETITNMGGSVHSIDEVEVTGAPAANLTD